MATATDPQSLMSETDPGAFGDEEEQALPPEEEGDELEPLEPSGATNSNLPGVKIVVDPYSDLEWIGIGVAVFAFFFIVPYLIITAFDISLRLLMAIYYPLGIGYILVLHQKWDRKDKFRNNFAIRFIDQKDYVCIAYLIVLLCVYAIDHHTHGDILDTVVTLFGKRGFIPSIWTILVILAVGIFMAVSSASVVLMASRKTFVTFRLVRTMQPGKERTMVAAKGAVILTLSVAMLSLSRKKSVDGEYHGPPFGTFFWGTCEACLFLSSCAAIINGVQYLRKHDWSSVFPPGGQGVPALGFRPARETPE